jgi:hypothetical protein
MTTKKAVAATALKSSHACINGRVLVFEEPSKEVAAFLDRVRVAASSSKVRENDLIALVYGRENPLLDQTMAPGYSMVTREVFENPIYRVLLDLLDRKRIKLGLLDPVKAAARYTLSVQEAADRVGVQRNAINVAVETGKLPVWVKDGRLYLDPDTLHAYQPEKRGHSSRLRIRYGNATGGLSLKFKAATELEEVTSVEEHIKEGWLGKWKRIGVMTGAKSDGSYRFVVLEPGGVLDRIGHKQLYVEGRFRVVEKVNLAEEAHEAWKKFEPA